jgi:hypothetical protein
MRAGETDWPAKWFHPESSETVTRGQNNSIKMGDPKESKNRTRRFIDMKTLLKSHYNSAKTTFQSQLKHFSINCVLLSYKSCETSTREHHCQSLHEFYWKAVYCGFRNDKNM